MKNVFKILVVLVVLAPLAQAADSLSNLGGSPAIAELQGKVHAITGTDVQVEDSQRKIWNVHTTTSTAIVNPDNKVVAIDALHTDDRVRVYWDTRSGNARQIDLNPSPVRKILGAP
jgi:hypothetical protein